MHAEEGRICYCSIQRQTPCQPNYRGSVFTDETVYYCS